MREKTAALVEWVVPLTVVGAIIIGTGWMLFG